MRGADAGGEAASLREAPLLQTPTPEERLAFGLCASAGLVPPERWCSPLELYESTEADRAAADMRRGEYPQPCA